MFHGGGSDDPDNPGHSGHFFAGSSTKKNYPDVTRREDNSIVSNQAIDKWHG